LWLLGHNPLTSSVASLFGFFGIKSLLTKKEEEKQEGEVVEKLSHGIFVTTFIMLFLGRNG
jgi:putative Ca2+/H+ antiporter (TMEM165/GDT1 family)